MTKTPSESSSVSELEALIEEMKTPHQKKLESVELPHVHSLTSDDGKHWECAFCAYTEDE